MGDKEDIRQKVDSLETYLWKTNQFQVAGDLFFGIVRSDEMWADKYGIWSLNAAGYDPSAMISLFGRFDSLERSETTDDAWIRLLELVLSSHPPPRDRVKLLQIEVPWMRKNPTPISDSEQFRALKARLASESPEKTPQP